MNEDLTFKLEVKQPVFNEIIPSTGKAISCRPWLVKEERILLVAKESGEKEDITTAVLQCLKNCILSDVNINSLTPFDIDYLFVKLKAKSVGDKTKIDFVCNNIPDANTPDKECGADFSATISVADLKTTKEIVKSFDLVPLTDKISVAFKYPSFVDINKKAETDFDETINYIIASIDYFERADENMNFIKVRTNDFSREQIVSFVENLTTTQFEVLNNFIENLPSYYIDTTAKCPKCGFEHSFHFEDLPSFFQ